MKTDLSLLLFQLYQIEFFQLLDPALHLLGLGRFGPKPLDKPHGLPDLSLLIVISGPLDRAPRASILAETLVLQALSVLLQSEAKVTPQQYVKWHPGGSLGHLRENER